MNADPSLIRILAVDDEPEDASLQKTVLEAAGYVVDTALTLREAHAALARHAYAVLLLDLRLPDGDGLSLFPQARGRDPQAVALVLTGFASVETAVAALKAGAYDYLSKPCPPEMMVQAVNRAAQMYSLRHALADRTAELEALNRALDGRVADSTRAIFDLNERLKRTIRELRESNRTQTRFLEDMAHELKNPLSVIWGYTSFLLRRPLGDWTEEELMRSLQSVHRNAEHLQLLIEELLDSSRLATQKIRLNRESFPAADAVGELLGGLRVSAEEAGVELESDIPEAGALVHADRNRLRQVLGNLVSNALKFTPRGGHVTVRVRSEGGRTHFCVEDTGPGIAPAHLERIFERFYQVHEPGVHHKGLGLGLSIVAGLVALHGGRVWAESEPGAGARFFFTLPATPAGLPDPELPPEGAVVGQA